MKKPLNINTNNNNNHKATSMQQVGSCFKRKHLLLNVIVNLLFNFQALYSTAANQQYQQHNNILNFPVFEGSQNNTYIGNIRSSDGQVPYLILPDGRTPESERITALNINLQNGDLTTNSVLDREHREQYHFIAIVKEPFAEIRCTVTVKDINDNPPMFLMPNANDTNFIIDMPEGQRGIRKLLPLAVDFDTPLYGIKEFRIVSGNTPSGTFQLVEHEAPARSSMQNFVDDSASSITAGDPQLMQQFAQQAVVLIPSQPSSSMISTSPIVNAITSASALSALSSTSTALQSKYLIDLEVNQILDRENQSSYQLVVEAIDGGQPPLLGRLMVTVNVQDVNDNDPIFTRKLYECQFREDTAKGTALIKVQAYDIDSDSNGVVSYFIKRHLSSSQAIANLTKINSSDNNIVSVEGSSGRFGGNININKQQQQQQQYQQQPQRSAVGGVSTANKLTASQQQQRSSNENYDSALSETSNNNSKIKSSYSGTGSTGTEQLFEIDSVKGEISLVSQLDFETDQWHELVIEARDHGKPSRSSYSTVKVYVMDVNDDPPVAIRQADSDKQKQFSQSPSSEASRAELGGSSRLSGGSANSVELSEVVSQNFLSYLAQVNQNAWLAIILTPLVALVLLTFIRNIRSRKPESDYNDTSNNVHTKQSPNHSTSNDHSNNSNDIHHNEHQRRLNGSFARLNGVSGGYESANGKVRYPYSDKYNIYHSLYPTTKQSPPGGGHHSLERHGMNNSMNGPQHHPGGSLTYAHHHSQVALLAHQAHHHQSTHHLSPVHHGHNKGGTMNSINTHHSAHPSASPLPATPNTTHSSGLPPNMHESHHGLAHNALLPLPPSVQQSQLPPTPCHASNVFSWPQTPGSTMSCFPPHNGLVHRTSTDSAIDCVAGTAQPLNRWFDLGVSSQLVYTQDWCGSYDWDYLAGWTPEYQTLMPLLEAAASDY